MKIIVCTVQLFCAFNQIAVENSNKLNEYVEVLKLPRIQTISNKKKSY